MQNKSQVGGVLTIISGVFGLIEFLGMIGMTIFLSYIFTSPTFNVRPGSHESLRMVQLVYGIMAFVLLVLGVVAIVGGIYAMKKRLWGMALAGAICGILTFLPLGIIATVFIAQAQKEFSSPHSVNTGTTGTLPQP